MVATNPNLKRLQAMRHLLTSTKKTIQNIVYIFCKDATPTVATDEENNIEAKAVVNGANVSISLIRRFAVSLHNVM